MSKKLWETIIVELIIPGCFLLIAIFAIWWLVPAESKEIGAFVGLIVGAILTRVRKARGNGGGEEVEKPPEPISPGGIPGS